MKSRVVYQFEQKQRNAVASFVCALIVHHDAKSIDSHAIASMLSQRTDSAVRTVLNALAYFGALERDSAHVSRFAVVDNSNDIVVAYAQDKRAQAQAERAIKALEKSAQARERQAHRKVSA